MDYKRISQIGMIFGIIASSFSLIISLTSSSDLIKSFMKAFITFIVIWFLTQVIWVVIILLVNKEQEEIEEEKKKVAIEEQKKKLEEGEKEAGNKAKKRYGQINKQIDDQLEKSKEKLSQKAHSSSSPGSKGNNADFTVDES